MILSHAALKVIYVVPTSSHISIVQSFLEHALFVSCTQIEKSFWSICVNWPLSHAHRDVSPHPYPPATDTAASAAMPLLPRWAEPSKP